MNCPVCSQWNGASQRRCVFCDNELGPGPAALDRTAAGKQPRRLTAILRLPRPPPLRGSAVRVELWRGLRAWSAAPLDRQAWGPLLIVLGIVLIVAGLVVRC
ncbi:MAG: hypothetical protein IPG96_10915 [Proteobacteria bacterium]|nr:hypothetical protein [Pseudomonadota bacterium]